MPDINKYDRRMVMKNKTELISITILKNIILLVSLVFSSSSLASTLIVQVRTDIVPGTELGWMRARFHHLADDGTIQPEKAVIDRWRHHSQASGWGSGVRIAEARVPDGQYRGEVTAYDPDGGFLVSRPVRILLTGGVRVVTVLMTIDPLLPPSQIGILPALETSHWTSEEETKDPIICPVNLAMHGLACNGSFCDNVRLHCRAVPGIFTQNPPEWTSFFSDGDGLQGCKPGEFATGLACRGGSCDDISLRCTKHTGTEESCDITDPISDGPPLSEFIDPTNGYVRGIICEGNNCDDKRLEICRLKQFPFYFGAFPSLCVTSLALIFSVEECLGAEDEENTSQVWNLDLQTGLIVNPLTDSCLTALGGAGAVTEEPCEEATDTSWSLDPNGRMTSLDPNHGPLCLGVAGFQDLTLPPPIGATLELGPCSPALYQRFQPTNDALPEPLPELDVGTGELLDDLLKDGFESLQVNIIDPIDNAIFVQADDADLLMPGFQVSVTFTTNSEAHSFKLSTQSGCDNTHSNCQVAVVQNQGSVANPGRADPAILITLTLEVGNNYQRIRLDTKDNDGSDHSSEIRLTVIITS